ncbi:MAG TPA: thioredoxin family protein [Candidatus Polarisedimenticolia bacterium]|jgi:thiol-disulfide isomerase/thioredoxin|nr:thioredoxin family protein [Candidatus Polarisedimenticolia bacterium]
MPSRRVLIAVVFAVVAAWCAPPSAQALEELAIGAQGAGFTLKGTDGKTHSLESVAGTKGTAVIFTCNECPYAKGYENRLIALATDYQAKGIGFVAINSNDPTIVPGDGFEFMVKRAKDKSFPYPYLFDDTQEIAKAYGARVTPHIFLLDAQGKLVYRGRIDDSLEEGKIKERDFSAALAAIVSGQPIKVAETKAFGCGVKYAKK